MKNCSKCKEEKDISEFYQSKGKINGYCKKCRKNIYLKNKDEIIKKNNLYNKNRDFGLYTKYWSMVGRCKYKNQRAYKWYGEMGIKVQWKSYK